MGSTVNRDREGIALAILIGVFVGLVILLGAVLITKAGGGGGPATTATISPTATTTTGPTTTDATTTTEPAATSSTTPTSTTTPTTEPFAGDTDWRNCDAPGSDAGTVFDVRHAQREGFTRVVFDFTGGVPACSVGYADPHTLAVIVHPIDQADPFEPGIFDAGGQIQVNTNSVNRVSSGGMGGGSGEWEFSIDLGGTRSFRIFTLTDPSRLAIDIED